jgi:hypothetical protein
MYEVGIRLKCDRLEVKRGLRGDTPVNLSKIFFVCTDANFGLYIASYSVAYVRGHNVAASLQRASPNHWLRTSFTECVS